MHIIKTLAKLFILIFLFSCTVPKEAKLLKKSTKEWRNSDIIFYAWADSPLSANFLTLRENGKFEYTSSGILKSFDAGTWTSTKDSIYLEYVDYQQNIQGKQKLIIDRNSSTLIIEGDSTPVWGRLKIMSNKLKD